MWMLQDVTGQFALSIRSEAAEASRMPENDQRPFDLTAFGVWLDRALRLVNVHLSIVLCMYSENSNFEKVTK